MNRNCLIAIIVMSVAVMLLLVGGVGVILYLLGISGDGPFEPMWDMPDAEIPEAGVYVKRLEPKKIKAGNAFDYYVASDAHVLAPDADGARGILAVFQDHAVILDRNLAVTKKIAFGSTFYDARIAAPSNQKEFQFYAEDVDIGATGIINAFLSIRSGGPGASFTVLDSAGKPAWTKKVPNWVSSIIAEDFDGDGAYEFAVAHESQLTLFDDLGNERWSRVTGYSHTLAAADVNGDGVPEIIQDIAEDDLLVFEGSGAALPGIDTSGWYHSTFVPLRWPEDEPAARLAYFYGGELAIRTLDGATLAKFTLPMANDEDFELMRAVPFLPRGAEKRHLAVLGRHGYGAALSFYLFTPDDELLYHEVLQGFGGDVERYPMAPENWDALIVAAGGLWRYDFDLTSAKAPPEAFAPEPNNDD